MPPVAERLRRAYPALLEWAGVGSIPANSDAQNVPSVRRWRFEMKLSPFLGYMGYKPPLILVVNWSHVPKETFLNGFSKLVTLVLCHS